jgi:hypothetical protein
LDSSDATVPEDLAAVAPWISSTIRRTSRKAVSDTLRASSFMPAQALRSNIHAGMTTPASSATTQTKTSSPPRFSRYKTAISRPRDGCHG